MGREQSQGHFQGLDWPGQFGRAKRVSVLYRVRCWCLCVLLSWGCARGPEEVAPDVALTEFLSAVEGSTHDPALRKLAFEWLDEASRAALKERAVRTASLAGRKLEPWEMLVPGRLTFTGLGRAGVRMQVQIKGDKAVVQIPIEKRPPAKVDMVREGGRWRVALGLTPQ